MYDRISLNQRQNQNHAPSQILRRRLKQNRHEKTIACNRRYYGSDYSHFFPFGI